MNKISHRDIWGRTVSYKKSWFSSFRTPHPIYHIITSIVECDYFLYIYFWLSWAFFAVHGFSLAAVIGGCSLVSVCGLLFAVASLVVEHGLTCIVVCRILPDQGLNPCPLHWQADLQPLDHQESPIIIFLTLESAFMVCTNFWCDNPPC